MKTIKEDEEMKTLVEVGDIIRLEGFTDDPIIAVAVMEKGKGCFGCALDSDVSCSVAIRDPEGDPHRISPCCIRPTWMGAKSPKFCKFKELDKVLEEL